MSRLSVDSNVDALDEATPSWADGATAAEVDFEDYEAERTYSRRRSLECSSVLLSIVGTESTQGHTLYIIQVSSGIKQWEVARRYRDFCYLDKQLRKNFPKLKIPALPPKQYLFSSTSAAVVEERRNQLESYLKTLIHISAIWSRNDLALFLNDGANSMMFIWNFERMRKLQDMLSSMTVENEHETAKLNTDLTLAKTQVQALQERLSRMEMLLLQQATGMASEELSPSAIRSLSGMGMDRSLADKLASEIDDESAQLYGESGASPGRKGSIGGEGGYATQSNDDDALNPLDHAIIEDAVQAQLTSGEALPPAELVQVLNLATQETTPAQNKTLLKNLKGKTPEQVRALAVSLQLQEAVRISNEVLNEKFDLNASPASARRGSDIQAQLEKARAAAVKALPTFPISAAESVLFAHRATGADAAAAASTSASSAWAAALCAEIDEIVQVLTPTEASLQARYKIFRYVRDLVSNTLGVQLFPIGSFVSHTFLPDGDIDASAFLCKNENDAWYVKVNEALCMSSFSHGGSAHPGSKHSSFDTLPDPPELIEAMSDETPMSISNVGFVNGDVKKIKIMINNTAVDISMNQVGSLYSQYLIEIVDKHVGQKHLFKRSLLLVEAWSRYESPRHTQGGGSIVTSDTGAKRLSPWAIAVMLIWVFNSEGARICSPVQALGHFLRLFACFDWSQYALTVRGPVSATDLKEGDGSAREDLFFPAKVLDKFALVEEELLTFRAQSQPTAAQATAAPSSAEATEEESIMIGEVEVKIDTTQRVEEAREIGTPVEDAASAAVEGPVGRSGHSTPAPLSKANSAALYAMVTERDAVYVQGLINIIDPAAPNRNLVEGLDIEGYQVVTSALYEGYKQFQTMCEAFAKLAPTQSGARFAESEVTKVLKQLLINTQLKVIGWNPNFKKKPGNLSLAFGSSHDLQALAPSNPDVDVLQAHFEDLEFSLRYAEMVLGGRINHQALVQMIIRILMHKGPMPVGEVGKNLQNITGSDNLSRRLKEQFSGLKRAIELATTPRLRMGAEHPFNPLVHLVPEDQIPSGSETSEGKPEGDVHAAPALEHHAYVFIPVLAAAALAAREKEALAAANNASSNSSVVSGKSSRSFRRQAPIYLDNASVSRGGNWANARRGPGRSKLPASPRVGGSMNYRSGSTPPMNMHYARAPAAAPVMVAHSPAGVLPSPFPGLVAVPVGSIGSFGSPQQGVNMAAYAQMQQQMQMQYMQQQQQMYQQYQTQMHPSMANSLSSSYNSNYGAQSPMAHSPMAHYQAYMNTVTGAAQAVPVPVQMQPAPQPAYLQPVSSYGAHEPQSSPKGMHGQQQQQQQHW